VFIPAVVAAGGAAGAQRDEQRGTSAASRGRDLPREFPDAARPRTTQDCPGWMQDAGRSRQQAFIRRPGSVQCTPPLVALRSRALTTRGVRGMRVYRYTGHVHKQRATFGNTFSNSTRVALQCPPDSPEPLTHFDTSKGQRTMQTTGFALPGTGFTAASKPVEANKTNRVYVQGSKVDLLEYYKTLESCNYEQILIKSGSSKTRLMAVQSEQGKAALISSMDTPAGAEQQVDVEEATFRYRCIQAAVGQKRLDDLEEQIRSKVVSCALACVAHILFLILAL